MELREKIEEELFDYKNNSSRNARDTEKTAYKILALIEPQWTSVGKLISEFEEEGVFLDNPHDHQTDRAAGKAYKDCAERLRELLP